jgi:hypothetical protein
VAAAVRVMAAVKKEARSEKRWLAFIEVRVSHLFSHGCLSNKMNSHEKRGGCLSIKMYSHLSG